jgi:UPF0716 protein FxsA
MPSPTRAIALLVLLAIPLLEIAALFKVGQVIGFWWTIAIVLGTGIAGAVLLRRQGLGTLRKVMVAAESGQTPVAPMLDGMVIVVAAVLLITPGLLADALGLLLLLPPVRALLVYLVKSRFTVVGAGWSTTETFRQTHRSGHPDPDITRDDDGIIIEGEYTRLDERSADPKRGGDKPRR